MDSQNKISDVEETSYSGPAYHGTAYDIVDAIRTNGFWHHQDKDDYELGRGAYFFIEGKQCPSKCAKNWQRHKNSESDKDQGLAVIRVDIRSDNVFNATTDEGNRLYHKLLEVIIERNEIEFGDKSRDMNHDKSKIWNKIAELTNSDVIINDLSMEKVMDVKLRGNVLNARVLCARESSSVLLKSMEVIEHDRKLQCL